MLLASVGGPAFAQQEPTMAPILTLNQERLYANSLFGQRVRDDLEAASAEIRRLPGSTHRSAPRRLSLRRNPPRRRALTRWSLCLRLQTQTPRHRTETARDLCGAKGAASSFARRRRLTRSDMMLRKTRGPGPGQK